MANIKQVSKLANVSVATVSRVINNNSNVRESTKLKVHEAMKALNYQPNAFAQSLATNKSNIIGLMVSDLSGPYFGPLMLNCEAAIRASGKHLIITSGHSNLNDELDAVDFLLKSRCDALILHADAMNDDQLIDLVESSNTPIIIMNRHIKKIIHRCIHMENFQGGRLATQTLLNLNHQQIACITGPQNKSDANDRYLGYQAALTDANLSLNLQLVAQADFSEQSGSQAIEEILASGAQFSAVFCGNDLMAIGAIKTLKQKGFRIPEDISVIGYDNLLMTQYVEPPLSTINVPVSEMGTMAAKLAINLSDNTNTPIQQAFLPTYIERQSLNLKHSPNN